MKRAKKIVTADISQQGEAQLCEWCSSVRVSLQVAADD